MTGKRTRYSAEFKAKVALEAIRGETTVAQLAGKHGIHQTMINAWKKQAMEGMARSLRARPRLLRRTGRRKSNTSIRRSGNWSWNGIFCVEPPVDERRSEARDD